MNLKRLLFQPMVFPVFFFGITILAGSILLSQPVSLTRGTSLSWSDALFTATSATCVTGLAVADTGSTFSHTGQMIILFLIQVGGLGIMTLTSLALYLFRQKVTLTDRIAVGQNLLQDPRFHLGRFLLNIVIWTFIIELIGAGLLHLATDGVMGLPTALFHAISAFCNAGFALYSSSLCQWSDSLGVNLIVIVLITMGGIGFFVLGESSQWMLSRLKSQQQDKHTRLSWYSTVVLKTSLLLVVGGTLAIFFTEFIVQTHNKPWTSALLASFFQAVSCRTAGFNTIPIGELTNVTLLLMMALMFIGAAPGSCGGGIKVTTFRALVAFLHSELVDREQTVIGRMALSRDSIRRAVSIVSFSTVIIGCGVLILSLSETGGISHSDTRGQFLEISFEVVSAFGTAGISTGITPTLSLTGKYTLIVLMFLGRLGPLLFVGLLHAIRSRELFTRPESDLLIG